MRLDNTTVPGTLIGITSIVLWSSLAYLSSQLLGIPPFQVLGLAFAIASIISALVLSVMKQWKWAQIAQQPYSVWALGIAGLFGYHACYFTALKHAPVAEASLLAYLWPLLIVIFSAINSKNLKIQHVAGALMGLSGTYVLIMTKGQVSFGSDYWFGYATAILAALIWSSYSVLNRQYSSAPLSMVFFFCLASAIGGLYINQAYELWVNPSVDQWFYIILLGLGPLGLAFFTWDIGTKQGDIALLGTLAYLTPLLSTALLVYTGMANAASTVWGAAILIVGGALIAAIPGKRKK